jgi:hypothetical protein
MVFTRVLSVSAAIADRAMRYYAIFAEECHALSSVSVLLF